MTAMKRLAGWLLVLLMAVALCVTPARADLLAPDWDDDLPILDDENAEDIDGDGEIDDAAEDEQLVEDVPAGRKHGIPFVSLAAGVTVLAAGAATLIIRSGKVRSE